MTVPVARFGPTDIDVTRLCQGTAFRSMAREATNTQGEAVLRYALERGVRFFDSSNAYGWGGSERLLGAALRGRRDDVVVCTKVSPSRPPGPDGTAGSLQPFSLEYLREELQGSLQRLETDWVDLYLLHSPDGTSSPARLCEVMQRLLDDGAVRHWGLSNHSAGQVDAVIAAARAAGTTPPVGCEEYYTIAGRVGDDGRSRVRLLEAQMFPLLQREGLGLLAFSPMDCGDLAPGRDVAPGSLAGLTATLDDVAEQLATSRAAVCVAWVLANAHVTAVLGGAESPEHVDEMLAGAVLELPGEILTQLNAASHTYSRAVEAAA